MGGVGILLLAFLTAALLAGVVLAWRGWRGVAIDDHPLCRRCGYDLHGRPAGAADHCPECGADVSAPRARRIGHRRRRRSALVAGVLLLAVSIGVGAAVSIVALRGYDWNRIKPVWLLLQEARGPGGSAAAVKEFVGRLTTNRLSQRQIDTVADAALAEQADASAMWQPLWGEFLEQARTLNQLSDARWQRYANQMLDYAIPSNALTVSQRLLPRNELRLTVTYPPTRTGYPPAKLLYLQTTIRASGALLADKQYKSEVEHPLQMAGGNYPQPYTARVDPAKSAAARSGEQMVSVTVEAVVSEVADWSIHEEREPGKYPPVVTRTVTLTAPWHLMLAATQPARVRASQPR